MMWAMSGVYVATVIAAAHPASSSEGERRLSSPPSVSAFIARRDKCDHFRGEDPYDKARARFLAAQVQRYCTGTDRALERLRKRHAGNPAVLATLAKYEADIE